MSTEDVGCGEVLDGCSERDRAFLNEAINVFNFETTGITDGRDLACLIRDDEGSIIAGIYGWTWGGFCEIESLWVRSDHRRGGLGTRLLAAGEAEARRRGATHIGLDTHGFQAPEFYRARGYQVIGEQPDYPIGHTHLFLTKRLS